MKRGLFCIFAGVLILSLISSLAAASLGITPAKKEFNFAPNEKYEIKYLAYSDDPGKKIKVYAEEGLSQYITLSRSELVGRGEFVATLNLPPSIDTPGRIRTLITAAEVTPQSQFIGTSLRIRAAIYVNVPYPGKYIESSLNIPDANIGENVPVELSIINRGSEELTVNPIINFYDSSTRLVDTFTFEPVQLKPSESDYFRRYLNTADFKPDNYLAHAVIDYSGLKQDIKKTIRVGNLYINITDFTRNVSAEGINKFIVGIKSNWNDNIKGVYADVRILNETFETWFRVPSVDLEAWEEKNMTGYFEAGGLKGGEYRTEIVLYYLDLNTFGSGKLFVSENNKINIPLIAGGISGAIAILAIVYLIINILKKPKGKKRK